MRPLSEATAGAGTHNTMSADTATATNNNHFPPQERVRAALMTTHPRCG